MSGRERELILNAPLGMDTTFEPSDIRRFMGKVKLSSDCECWMWKGHCDDKGYGQFRYKHRAYWAHRISFAIFRRPLIPSLTVEHKCRNPSCVNPWHLELLTNQENVDRQHSHNPDTVPF